MIKYRFIVIEGPDGVGKTTIARELFSRLKRKYKNIFLTKEPTDYLTGIFSKHIINELDLNNNFDNLALACLYTADRLIHQKIIREKLNQGYIVISDRYYHSSFVYQILNITTENKNEYINWLLNINKYLLKPDITFILDAPYEIIEKRLSERKKLNIYEKNYIKNIIEGYKNLKEILKDENIIYIDNSKGIIDAVDQIMSYLL